MSSFVTNVAILGSGFGGIEVLKNLQKQFHNNKNIEITLVSKDNFFLFTPMLAEVASGMIETRHIVTPVRSFCKKAKFIEADVQSIELVNKQVILTHEIDTKSQANDWHKHTLKYDYLVIALGSENNFFKMTDVQKHSFSMKTINDAIILRNHIINMLERASLEDNVELRKNLLTFVVSGGGFTGVETAGAINDFVRESIRDHYKNIYMTEVRIILIDINDKLLLEVDEQLGEFALEKLKARGVEFMFKSPVSGATTNSVKLHNGTIIPSYTLIWTAGVTPSKLIVELAACEHDASHRIVVNNYLEVPGYNGKVYALGDCASVTDPRSGKPYSQTAQHAIRQGKVAAKNIISSIKRKAKKKKFDYKTKGMMAEIGRRVGVAILFDRIKLHGFVAWWLWRTYYLANLPTANKKLKVLGDWTSDLIFKPDISMIKVTSILETDIGREVQESNSNKDV